MCIDEGSTIDSHNATIDCSGVGEDDDNGVYYSSLSRGEEEGEYDRDLPLSPLFRLCGDNDYGAREISFSLANTTSFQHFSSATTHLLLRGRVVWGVVPPSLLTNTSLLTQLQDTFNVSLTHLQDMLVYNYNDIFQYLFVHHLVVLVEQREGEVVYLPPHYAAYTISVSASMLISMEICAHDIREQRVQPLGYAVYGGQDEYRGYGFEKTHHVSNMEVDASLRPKKKPPVFQDPHIH
ncbi:hypothetical protein EON65_26225 [archaeon]|nr:MAG: hypothetical protein EON65_26225 [archaeon]